MMDALEQARREIDTVDAQLAALFERRMKAVLSVAEYKKAHGLPIFDAAREKVVLDKAEARIGDPALRPYYRDHVQNMMDVAKQYEAEVLGRSRAAYQGVEGAFAHIALRACGASGDQSGTGTDAWFLYGGRIFQQLSPGVQAQIPGSHCTGDREKRRSAGIL